jgi:NADH-ubiquinone oxidoreductase chain 5
MYLTIVLLPFIGAFFAGSPTGRYIGTRGAVVVAITCMLLSFLGSVVAYYEVVYQGCTVVLNFGGTWFESGNFGASWCFHYDLLAVQMLVTVTGVSLAVHMYAADYMRSDPHLNLFMSYLSLFTAFMLVLVSADNLLVMLIGYEGIGVCSYLLIGYWSHRLSAVKSAQKAILVNRVSDGMLMWGIIWIWYHLGSLEYDLINVYASSQNPSFIGLTILIGAMGKSAQILFHVWLADAMEGVMCFKPTPFRAGLSTVVRRALI